MVDFYADGQEMNKIFYGQILKIRDKFCLKNLK